MKAENKCSKVTRTTTSRKVYNIVSKTNYGDPYPDEYTYYYPIWRKGFKNPIKRIMSYQVRMYKTWKHNRKTQWKI